MLKALLSFPLIALVKLYQWLISPVLPRSCRFTPTCSQYSLEALKRYGPIKGSWLAARRITRCHPGNIGGWDPVPNPDGSQDYMIETNAHIDDGLKRLNAVLPLQARQQALAGHRRQAHRLILNSLIREGRLPDAGQLQTVLGDTPTDEALAHLAELDLVVLVDGKLVGAYPLTTEATQHQVQVFDRVVHAMCALDALSVASMVETDTVIDSRCAVSGTPIHIEQTNLTVMSADPASPMVGIRWQSTCGHAAHSLCMEMIFLADRPIAEGWKSEDSDNRSIYELDEAIIFGQRFFKPLLDN